MPYILSFFFIVPLWLLPDTASAQLLACTGATDCNFCTAVITIQNIINFVVMLAVILATIMLAITGFKMVMSKGNPGAMQAAKDLLINICIGVVLILAAWTLVDTLLKILVRDDANVELINFGPQYRIDPADCGGSYAAGTSTTEFEPPTVVDNTLDLRVEHYINEIEVVGNGGAVLNTAGTPVVPNLSGLVSLRAAGVNVASWQGIDGPGRTDTAHPAVVAAAKRMQDLAVSRYGKQIFQVTAAYTEGVGHSAGSKHYQGIAIDFDPINGGTNAQVAALAREVGFTYVLDEGSHVHADMRGFSNAQ